MLLNTLSNNLSTDNLIFMINETMCQHLYLKLKFEMLLNPIVKYINNIIFIIQYIYIFT